MTRISSRWWKSVMVVAGISLAAAITACPPGESRVVIVRAADSLYDFGPERPPLTADDPSFKGPRVPDGTIPRMWIATATLKSHVPVPKDRIIARIRSEGRYSQMGISAGYNYVWRSSRDTSRASRWVTRIIAADTAVQRHDLTRDDRLMEYTHGDPSEPRLVILTVHSMALGLCLDDPTCRPVGHCGYY